MLTKPNDIPSLPGVYKWRDSDARVIYVGKAKNLKARLGSYFQSPEKLHPRTAQMVQRAVSVEWTITQNEIEALTLEFAWINEFEPRFNVIFRNDDKSYPYLALTAEEFPRMHITRENKRRNIKYFGPYPKTWAIHQTFSVLQEVFGIRNCANSIYNGAKRAKRACLLGYIGKCLAPCVNDVQDVYGKNIIQLKKFLNGDVKSVQSELQTQMLQASENLQFEVAQKKRDQLEAIEVVIKNNTVELGMRDNFDMVGTWGDDLELGVHVFFVRKGIIVGEKVWILERGVEENDATCMQNVIAKLYVNSEADIPSTLYVSHLPPNHDKLAHLLSGIRKTPDAKIKFITPERGEKRSLMQKTVDNAKETLETARKRRASDLQSRTSAIQEIQNALGLSTPPLRIECYDISHTQGEYQTGAMVVFEDGLAKKKDYRLFNLQGKFITWDKDGVPDDTAAVYEVIKRRLEHIADENFAYTPNLLLIDGGKPQVGAAYRALQDAGHADDIKVAGIAKRLEELWTPNEQYPLILPRHSLGLYLIQQLRDEAHRFSIVSMRKRRSKKYRKSVLDSISGLGDVRQRALLKHFKSVKNIRAASAEEIAKVPSVSLKLAESILEGLSER